MLLPWWSFFDARRNHGPEKKAPRRSTGKQRAGLGARKALHKLNSTAAALFPTQSRGPDMLFASLQRSVVEIVLKPRMAIDYRTRPFLQLAVCSLEKRRANLHMQILSQSYSFGHVA
jgi:hypothetical protein